VKRTSTSTPKKATAVKASSSKKPKAKATSVTSKSLKKKNHLAAKKYSGPQGRKQAMTDYRKNRASEVKKSWDKQPDTRPDYIPQSVNVGGRSQTVVFNNGGYGYYMGGAWTPLDYAMHMVVTDAMLRNHGYGNWHNGAIVVERHPMSTPGAIAGIVIAVLFLGTIIFIFVKSN